MTACAEDGENLSNNEGWFMRMYTNAFGNKPSKTVKVCITWLLRFILLVGTLGFLLTTYFYVTLYISLNKFLGSFVWGGGNPIIEALKTDNTLVPVRYITILTLTEIVVFGIFSIVCAGFVIAAFSGLRALARHG